ncbi:hypothetical protein F4694_000268 [Bacillus niacini]|uniref:Uncharacterized protein n=1 Tax=Neobacillus niacini TaxID=86668 RepID=A0A852T6T9_9BACI|nr:hypothetical protein [Neobacillus niacini]
MRFFQPNYFQSKHLLALLLMVYYTGHPEPHHNGVI